MLVSYFCTDCELEFEAYDDCLPVCPECGFTDGVELDDDVEYPEPREDQFMSDAEADADVLRSAGWGTAEDYGYYGEDDGGY